MLLQELNGHDNIIRLLNVIKAENNMDLYLVFEYMETDLYNVIRANILKDIHQKFVVYQMFKALKYLHSAEIIHRDLKPSNVFINSDCHVKLGDFGLARTMSNDTIKHQPLVTDYVATRWYRAPEMLLGSTNYGMPVDMWSIGCIMVEMLIGKALFPGTSTKNQIALVLEITGLPKKEDYNEIRDKYQLQAEYYHLPNNIKRKSLKRLIPYIEKDCYDLIIKLLAFDPSIRPTVEEALEHPYVSQFHNIDEEIVCDRKIQIALDDNKRYKINYYQKKLYEEVLKRKLEIRKKILENFNKKK
jgi:mitogen-activated protein kinase 15